MTNSNLSGQYAPKGSKWIYEWNSAEPPYQGKNIYVVEKDTFINGLIYSNISDLCYLTKNDSKVYCSFNGQNLFLFDFKVNKGDTLKVDMILSRDTGLSYDSVVHNFRIRVKDKFYLTSGSSQDSSLSFNIEMVDTIKTGENYLKSNIISEKMLFGPHYEFNLLTLFESLTERTYTFHCYEDSSGYIFKYLWEGDCDAVGITEIKIYSKESMNVYPNPTSQIMKVKILDTEKCIEGISIYDMTGKLIFYHSYSANEITLNMTAFSTGTYLIIVELDEGRKQIKKLVRKN